MSHYIQSNICKGVHHISSPSPSLLYNFLWFKIMDHYFTAMHTENSHHGWVDLYEAPLFSNDGQGFLVRLPVREGAAGEFRHVNLFNIRLRIVTPLTHGPFEVTQILGWDHNNNYIYFLGTAEERPSERHLYRVSDILTSTLLRSPECMSCFEAENSTNDCLYNKAHFSPEFSYFVLECLGPDVPRTYLISTHNLEVCYYRKPFVVLFGTIEIPM
ncbi:Inactive dipeptidyl peptidase 10 [Armadillidium nasatum]|uniref:Inactive dipeptidyl peptidase 10 n=1 Tax=Armadillidium nasatum TaxID=96803 RepID=A0A5N5TN58_9CRUS|nr:Inactive dipeptidyl peptidase 10 [Armadillidium nasatum]